MTILDRIINWNIERNIPVDYKKEKEAAHITEELTELLISNTKEDDIDAFADIIVFVTGAIYKAGYDPNKVMNEVLKHIESRKGSWSDKDNKWIKEDCEMYQQDWDKCKL